MIKKILLGLLLLIVLGFAVLFGWRYIGYVRDPDPNKTFMLPRLEMAVIDIQSLTSEKTEMTTGVLIKNQLPFAFTADSFQYRLFINDAEIMRSRYKKSFTLEGSDSSWIYLPVTVFNHDIDSVIKANELRNRDSAEYRLHASFYTDIIFRKHFDITIRRYLPLIHIPGLQVEKVEVDSLNFKRAYIVMHTVIRNDNVFDIKVRDYHYELKIEDHEWVDGKVNGLTTIKAKSSTPVELPVYFSIKELSKTFLQLITKGKKVNYELKLNLKIESDQKMMKNSKVFIRSTGSVKSLLKAVKGKPE